MSISTGGGPGGVSEALHEVAEVHGDSTGGAETKVVAEGRSPMQIALSRLRRDKVAVGCVIVVILFVLVGIFAPVISGLEGQSPTTAHYDLVAQNTLPTILTNRQHWLGVTASNGYDVFARLVYGIRPSLLIAVSTATISTLIGLFVGLIAGFAGGWVDRTLSWLIDFALSLPFLLLAIALVPIMQAVILGPNGTPTDSETQTIRIVAMLVVLSFLTWGGVARLIRGEVLSLREREFVQAARAQGASPGRVMFKEILPNLTALFLVNWTTAIPAFISAEAGLSYLGVGLTLPTADWGLDISEAQNQMQNLPIPLLAPLICLMILVLCLSLLGDAISDAFNPNTRR